MCAWLCVHVCICVLFFSFFSFSSLPSLLFVSLFVCLFLSFFVSFFLFFLSSFLLSFLPCFLLPFGFSFLFVCLLLMYLPLFFHFNSRPLFFLSCLSLFHRLSCISFLLFSGMRDEGQLLILLALHILLFFLFRLIMFNIDCVFTCLFLCYVCSCYYIFSCEFAC